MNSIYLMVLAWVCCSLWGFQGLDMTELTELNGFRIIQNNYLTLGEYGSLWDFFSQELIHPIYIFKLYAFKTVYNIPFNGFCHPFDGCRFSRDIFQITSNAGNVFSLLFFPWEVCQFYGLFKESVFVSLIYLWI